MEDIGKVVRFVPTLHTRQKYKVPNTILAVFLFLTAVLKMLGVYVLLSDANTIALLVGLIVAPAINVIFGVLVLRYYASIYQVILVLTLIGVVRSMGKIDLSSADALLDITLIATTVGLAIFLMVKVASGFELKTKAVTNEKGEKTIKKWIVFNDSKPVIDSLDA